MDRTAAGWSEPRNLGAPVNSAGSETTTSVTSDGTLYIGASGREGGPRTGRRLYRSRFVDGRYETPEPLPAPVDAGEEDSNQYVSPDGRFMIFMSETGRRRGRPLHYVLRERRLGESRAARREAERRLLALHPTDLARTGKRSTSRASRAPSTIPPIAPMSYTKFVEAIRSPGNGLADIYELAIEALSLRPAR